MSKESEALEAMRADVIDFRDIIENSSYSTDEDYKIVKQALKRNEPKKIIVIPPTTIPSNFRSDYLCPNCNHECLVKYQNYCDICGQRLDWSNEND